MSIHPGRHEKRISPPHPFWLLEPTGSRTTETTCSACQKAYRLRCGALRYITDRDIKPACPECRKKP